MEVDNINNVKIITKYNFNHNIDKVFKMITDINVIRELMKDELNELTPVRGNNLSEEGSICLISHKLIRFYLIVNKVISEDNFKFIHQSTFTNEPSMFKIFTNLYFYWNSIEKQTVYVKEMYIIKESIKRLEIELYQSAEKHRLKLMDNRMTEEICHTESIMIYTSMERLWYVVSDWREFVRCVPMIGKSVDYFDEPRSVGTRFDLDDGNGVHTFWVAKAELGENISEFVIEVGNGVDSPRQEVGFKLDYVDTDITFLSFRHVFKDPVRLSKLAILSKEKKEILKTLKDSLME